MDALSSLKLWSSELQHHVVQEVVLNDLHCMHPAFYTLDEYFDCRFDKNNDTIYL
jgi:hypothetical protein